MFRTITSSASFQTLRAPVLARSFHASPAARKTVTEKVSEVADKVNKKVGKGLASALDTGEKAANIAKDKMGTAAEETKQNAQEAGSFAEQKANQATAGAREAKRDFKQEMRK